MDEKKEIDPHDAVKLALLAGELMVSCGGETYRAEDTMKRILESCGFEMSESFVATTGIFASCEDKDAGIITAMKRVKTRGNEFEKLIKVNEISRKFTNKELSVSEAMERLSHVSSLKKFPDWLKLIASGVASACFCYLLGGRLPDSANSLLTGLALQACLILLYRTKMPGFLINIIGGGIMSIVSGVIFILGLGESIDRVIIGSLMPMLPGLSMTNAIRDVVEGDLLSGTTRMTDAVLTAVAIAAGVGVTLNVVNYFAGGVLLK